MSKYTTENIQLVLAGKVVAGCTGIDYEETAESTPVHVLGQKDPFAVIKGRSEYQGTLMLIYDEYDAIQDSIPKGRSLVSITDFEILVTRLDANDILRTDKLKGVRFTSVKKSYKPNETAHEIELPISIREIEYNV